MNTTDIIALFGAATGFVGVLTGGFACYQNYKINKKIDRPKIKINLARLNNTNHCADLNFSMENISDFNLYNFKIDFDEYDELINEKCRDKIHIFKSEFPVFPIGQKYETYLLNLKDCKGKTDYLNFKITYSLDSKGKNIIKENYKINIRAISNAYKIVVEDVS